MRRTPRKQDIESVTIIDVLRRAGAEVTVASVEETLDVKFSWGIKARRHSAARRVQAVMHMRAHRPLRLSATVSVAQLRSCEQEQ